MVKQEEEVAVKKGKIREKKKITVRNEGRLLKQADQDQNSQRKASLMTRLERSSSLLYNYITYNRNRFYSLPRLNLIDRIKKQRMHATRRFFFSSFL